MIQLSKNFNLSELTKSVLAEANNITNNPTDDVILNLTILVNRVLQPIRNHYNKPVIITSGYRSPKLNQLVKGSNTSDHCYGKAADIHIQNIDNFELATWIKDNLKYKQVILEFYNKQKNSGWVHVSYDSSNLKYQALTSLKTNKGKTIYKEGLIV